MSEDTNHLAQRSLYRLLVRIGVLLVLPLFVIWAIAAPPAAGFLWDWANTLGYIAALLIILLFIYRGQMQAGVPLSGRFFVDLHRDLGYAALLLSGLHVLVLLVSEPLLLEHLKPTAPWYMLAGLACLLLLATLVWLSLPALRKGFWSDYRLFRQVHLWLALAVLLLLYIHVLGSRFYLNSYWKQGGFLVFGALVLLVFIRGRYRPRAAVQNSTQRLRGNGVTARLISAGCAALAVVVALMLIAVNRLL